ncbi:hypothetical protein ACFWPX_08800 [Nocardia sp. NPDC058518]|uniref:hypothetical protein n=1 Tax=Nocardia sp. NPDC058518 TaxID=3346534 RepID=UPI003667EE65
MALTQQFVRVSTRRLALCQSSVDEVDRLCSFEGAPASDYRDLDWARAPLLRVFELSGVDAETLATMRHALDGHEELNLEYRGHPNTILVHPVTVVAPYTVAQIAKTLAENDFRMVSAALPEDAEQARQALGDPISSLLRHPTEYLAPHFDTLRDFYVEAAQRSMAVVTWWD